MMSRDPSQAREFRPGFGMTLAEVNWLLSHSIGCEEIARELDAQMVSLLERHAPAWGDSSPKEILS